MDEDILVPAKVWRRFLESIHSRVSKDRDGFVAEMKTELEAFRSRLAAREAVLHAQLEVAAERKMKAMEEEIERKQHEAEEQIARRMSAIEEEIDRKARATADEIARLRQLERTRIIYEAERDEGSQLQ